MLSIIEKVMMLQSVNMFAGTDDEVLAGVASILREVQAQEGDEVVTKGDLGSNMYVIVSGSVRVHDGQQVFAKLGEGNVFGELAALDPEPRSASVTADEDTLLLSLDNGPLLDLISDHPEIAEATIRFLCRRVRSALPNRPETVTH